MNNKQQILSMAKAEFSRWGELLGSLSEAQITAPRLPDNLSIKDTMAHLMAWHQLSIARLEAALQEQELELSEWLAYLATELPDEEPNEINAAIYEKYRDRPWSIVYQDWRAGFLRFLELGQAIPEERMMDAKRYSWLEGYSLADVLTGSYEHHHNDHLEPLLAWLGQQAATDAE